MSNSQAAPDHGGVTRSSEGQPGGAAATFSPLPYLPTRPADAWNHVVIAFAGLTAFVPEGLQKLTVLLPDARGGSTHAPPHGAAIALARIDENGALCDLTTKVLDNEVLTLQSGDTELGKGTIVLDDSYLAAMQQASGTSEPNNGRVREGCMSKLEGCVAAVGLEARFLGVDVRTVYAKDAVYAHFGDGAPYELHLTDDVRLVMPVPRQPLVLTGRACRKDPWRMTLSEPRDRAACLLVMNLPLQGPDPAPPPVDHHFAAYYELLREKPDPLRFPHYPVEGGHVPKCAMAVMQR